MPSPAAPVTVLPSQVPSGEAGNVVLDVGGEDSAQDTAIDQAVERALRWENCLTCVGVVSLVGACALFPVADSTSGAARLALRVTQGGLLAIMCCAGTAAKNQLCCAGARIARSWRQYQG